MGYSYLKSTIKNSKIIERENTLIAFAFIKIITRCIKLGFKIIYLDESGLISGNNNYLEKEKKMKKFILFVEKKREKI